MFRPGLASREQSEVKKNSLFRVAKAKFLHFPVSIRLVSWSLFLFILGWGLGAETFFSVYIFEVTQVMQWASIILLIAVVVRAIFTLPVANLEKPDNIKRILVFGKILYILCGLMYFAAGMTHQIWLLVLAAVLNAIGADAIYTSYITYLRLYTTVKQKTRAFGFFFSSFNGALVLGGLFSALIVKYVPMPYLYLFVVAFAALSIIPDRHFIQTKIKNKAGRDKFWKKFVFSVVDKRTYKDVFDFFKKYKREFSFPLGLWFVWSVLNYVSYFFVPLLGYQRDLTLSEVAIVFVVMRLPYLVSCIMPELGEKMGKKNFVLMIYTILAGLFVALGFVTHFTAIVILSLGISISLAITAPLISASFSKHIPKSQMGNLTGFQEFSGRVGEIVAMGFLLVVSTIFDLPTVFLWAGSGLLGFSLLFGIRRYIKYRRTLKYTK